MTDPGMPLNPWEAGRAAALADLAAGRNPLPAALRSAAKVISASAALTRAPAARYGPEEPQAA